MPPVITSRALAEEALDTAGRALPQGQLRGHVAVCSKENSSLPMTPISADQAHKMHTQAGLDAGVHTRLQGVHCGGGGMTVSKHCISLVPGRDCEALDCSMSLPGRGLGHSYHSNLCHLHLFF